MGSFLAQRIDHPQFLEYAVEGEPTEQDWLDLMERVKDDTRATDKRRVLIDAQKVPTPVDTMTRYRIGIEVGKVFGAEIRIACYKPHDTVNYFWETVARNRGGKAKAGDDREELIAWLMKED